MRYDEDDGVGQGELLLDAIERSGRPRKAVAAELGVAYQTLDGWIREDRRVPIRKMGLLCKVVGPWLLNQLLEAHGYKVIRLSTDREDADPFETIREAGLRLGGASGRVTTEVADATDPAGPGGAVITSEEGDRIRSSIREARAYLDAMEERLNSATSAN